MAESTLIAYSTRWHPEAGQASEDLLLTEDPWAIQVTEIWTNYSDTDLLY